MPEPMPDLDAERQRADAIFSLLQQVRDHDSLDITDEEIRDGHHRAEWYEWIAMQAWNLGAARAAEAERERIASAIDALDDHGYGIYAAAHREAADVARTSGATEADHG